MAVRYALIKGGETQGEKMDAKVNILLVDDRPENLRALEAILDVPDWNIVKAASGAEALKQVLRYDFAAILLDVQMPGLDGFETATLIRKRKRSSDIPILFVTAISKEEHYVFRGYHVGAVDYIFKPLDPQILRAKISVFVELYRKNQQVLYQAELLHRSEERERERELAELKQRSERRYRNLADSIPQIVWIAGPKGRIRYLNRRGIEYAGAGETHRPSPRLLSNLVHPDDRDHTFREWERARAAEESFALETRLRRSEGSYRWHLVQVLAEKDGDGNLVAWLGTATDIDDQKRIAQALAAEKEQLAITLRSIGDGVITTDTEGRIVLLNAAAERLTGWGQVDAAGRPLVEVFQLEGPKGECLSIEDLLSSADGEARALLPARGDDTRRVAHTCAPIRDEHDEMLGVVVVFRDVTDKQKLEEERQKASKLESVGVLAGAIAHDFNNILTAIMGNISLARIHAESNREASARLVDAENAIMWAKDLTQQLLTFSKGGAPVRKTCATFGQVIRDAGQFAARGSHVRCQFAVEEPLWPLEVDEGQMRQVVHNLVLNAQQAMPGGGEITISASNVVLTHVNQIPLPPGRYVKLRCADSGIGISAEHLPKIFDPYFTTKQKGSGLGLATTYSIVKKHDGLITVESQLGVGTHFDIYLPASEAQPTAQRIAPAPPGRGQGRILVMDDEARIRDMLRRVLGHFGYEVEVAEDGREALRVYREACLAQEPFDLVIMDLVIPGGMGGRETMKELLKIDAEACVIVSSGYSNDPVMAGYRDYGFSDAVAKPYRNEELRWVIHRLITRRRCAA